MAAPDDNKPKSNPVLYPEQVKFKVLFVGDSCVGKTSFISRYCEDTFNISFIATVGIDLKIKRIQRDDKLIVLELWDTAGQERYRSITPAMYNKANGFVVMFDLTNRQSYLNCQFWIEAVTEAVVNPVVLLVGNKEDLEENRVVSGKEAKEFASRRQIDYFECSIKERTGFQELMDHMINKLTMVRVRKVVDDDSIFLTTSPLDGSNPASGGSNDTTDGTTVENKSKCIC